MCRSTEIHGYYQAERDRLKIKAFYVRLLLASSKSQKSLPESLTLLYLPRINGNPLEIDELKIRPDSSAFVTLYRVRSEEERDGGEAIYTSRERVKASEGVRFEVYSREEKVLKGIFRKDEDEEWRMECRCALEGEMVGVKMSQAEVCVAVDGHVVMIEKVEMVVRRRRRQRGKGFRVLDEIPEEREEGEDEFESGSVESCCCCCDEFESGSEEGCCGGGGGGGGEEMMMEEGEGGGGQWAVDVGFWVMCLGVGYLVSKASSRSLRRGRILR